MALVSSHVNVHVNKMFLSTMSLFLSTSQVFLSRLGLSSLAVVVMVIVMVVPLVVLLVRSTWFLLLLARLLLLLAHTTIIGPVYTRHHVLLSYIRGGQADSPRRRHHCFHSRNSRFTCPNWTGRRTRRNGAPRSVIAFTHPMGQAALASFKRCWETRTTTSRSKTQPTSDYIT